MSDEKCQHKNPLILKGTAQEDRLPRWLDPDMVKIDGKTEEDYRRILHDLSDLVQYYKADHRRDDSWDGFFSEEEFKKEPPHIALFNAFVKLIRYAQDDINAITAKHLEFYYKDVLQIALKKETSDEAHILFELANNINSHLVDKNTYLRGGKDANGKERFFKTDDEIAVNKGAIKELKSVFVQEDEDDGTKLVYAAKKANSADGIEAELDEENPKWAPFGEQQNFKDKEDKTTMQLAEIGFAVASDFLLLKEGHRIVMVAINLSQDHDLTNDQVTDDAITGYFSGEEEWIEANTLSFSVVSNILYLNFEITADQKSIIAYNEEVFGEHFEVKTPVMKVLINQDKNNEVYRGLENAVVSTVGIDVSVSGVQDLVLQNETGTLDPTKPFHPFASTPVIGSEFLIGSKEVFSKQLGYLSLVFDWMDKPDLDSYYDTTYPGNTAESDFKIEVNALKDRSWNHKIHADDEVQLFQSNGRISFYEADDHLTELADVEEVTAYHTDLVNGFIKMSLTAPDKGPTTGLEAFGHSQYQNLYIMETIKMARSGTYTAVFPNEPYVPKVKSLVVDYFAQHVITLNAEPTEDSIDGDFFHVGPFGVKKNVAKAGSTISPIPVFENEGNFFIGVEKLEIPQNLNILFQVAEGSADPALLPEKVKWSYLNDNNWNNFQDTEVLTDGTNGMINSGIVSFSLPKGMTTDNSWIPGEMHWIRATVQDNSHSVCQMINVHAQAIKATFENNSNELSHLEEALPANTIAQLRSSNASIRKVEQPYASFNGKLPEEEDNYYRRVAERLRHKNRPITIWDYERIVLEEYSSIYKIKCLNHTRMNPVESYSERAPGHVSLVVISNLRNQNAVDPLKPTTSVSVLESINRYLTEIKNPFVTLHVENPFFEEIKVKFNVKFHEGKDIGLYKGKLNDDIKQHLSPWAYVEGEDISFDGIIHKSTIIDFIEELDYVDYLTCFQMFQIIDGNEESLEDINEATPTRSASLLVSAFEHIIDTDKLLTGDCSCEGDSVAEEGIITDGIGTMTIASDFIVNKP